MGGGIRRSCRRLSSGSDGGRGRALGDGYEDEEIMSICGMHGDWVLSLSRHRRGLLDRWY